MPPRTYLALGTVCSVNLFDSGSAELYDELYARLKEIDSRLSAHRTDSDIAAIHSAAGMHPVAVSEDTIAVLSAAKLIAEKTGGAFDPTVGAIARLWQVSVTDMETGTVSDGYVPSDAEIEAVLPLVDYRFLHIDETCGTVFLEKEGMFLDAGGIAKGYAADELVKILRRRNIPRALIDLGGNIYAFGEKIVGSTPSPWRVGIKNPLEPANPPIIAAELAGKTVVTSGIYERYFERGGVIYHHIFDPATGLPVRNNLASCTVIGESSMLADALATAVFVLGEEKGFALLSAEVSGNAIAAGICVLKNKEIMTTVHSDVKIDVLDASFHRIAPLPEHDVRQ
ncbi:MAG: FAD:protein FMN transferase [Bacteroides sp.]|nr:FAD:protein FMN transferase [Prevotella sp.]MCM1408660.1 FAD:protein FMN transferase [Treponema brennaborense]MCM1470521.1 FAD:protein FMN transferase [Bacteroides sp.]